MAGDKTEPSELDQEKYDADDNVKIICLGDSAVGKSKLMERFLMDGFQPQQLSTYALTLYKHTATVGGRTILVGEQHGVQSCQPSGGRVWEKRGGVSDSWGGPQAGTSVCRGLKASLPGMVAGVHRGMKLSDCIWANMQGKIQNSCTCQREEGHRAFDKAAAFLVSQVLIQPV